jgi:hypothetical protein
VGQFNDPKGIAIDSYDDIYLTHSDNNRLQIFILKNILTSITMCLPKNRSIAKKLFSIVNSMNEMTDFSLKEFFDAEKEWKCKTVTIRQMNSFV